MPDPVINWTRPKLAKFQKAIREAEGEIFSFDGHEFVVNYAKYLAEYLDRKLERSRG